MAAEMAHSLQYNRQFVYYDGEGGGDPAATARLLHRDREQLRLPPRALLKKAACFKNSDRRFIERTIDQHFGSREDAIGLVKAFVESNVRDLLALHAADVDADCSDGGRVSGGGGRHLGVGSWLSALLRGERAGLNVGGGAELQLQALRTPLLPS